MGGLATRLVRYGNLVTGERGHLNWPEVRDPDDGGAGICNRISRRPLVRIAIMALDCGLRCGINTPTHLANKYGMGLHPQQRYG